MVSTETVVAETDRGAKTVIPASDVTGQAIVPMTRWLWRHVCELHNITTPATQPTSGSR